MPNINNRSLIAAAALAVAGGCVFANAQQAAPQEPTYTIQLKPSRGMTIGALLEDQKCTVKEFASGTCAAWNAYADVNEQVNKQNQDAQRAQVSAFETQVREKLDGEAKAVAAAKEAEAKAAAQAAQSERPK